MNDQAAIEQAPVTEPAVDPVVDVPAREGEGFVQTPEDRGEGDEVVSLVE